MSRERNNGDAAGLRYSVEAITARGSFAGFKPVTFTNPVVELLAYLGSTEPPAWMREGSCHDTGNPDAWFPDTGSDPDMSAAIAICHRCPVRRECLTYATDLRLDGVWGGTTTNQRREARRGATA